MLDDPELTDYFDSRGAMMTQFLKRGPATAAAAATAGW